MVLKEDIHRFIFTTELFLSDIRGLRYSGPPRIKKAISLEPSVGLVCVKKITNLDHGGALEGLFSPRVPKNQPQRVPLEVHMGAHEGPVGSPEPW